MFIATVEKWIAAAGSDPDAVYDNEPVTAKDRVFVNRHGNVDRGTGFRRGTQRAPPLEDVGYSTGRLCEIKLTAVQEKNGVALCKDRNGVLLRDPEILHPIDWNRNGQIDLLPVMLDDGDVFLWKNYFRDEPATLQRDADKNEWEKLKDFKPRSRDGFGSGWVVRGFGVNDTVNELRPLGMEPDGRSLTHAFEIP